MCVVSDLGPHMLHKQQDAFRINCPHCLMEFVAVQTSLKSSKKKKRASVKCNKSSKKGVEVST